MIDLSRHNCLQGALEEAFEAFSDEPCLIEATATGSGAA
jgi:hypothetical protein